MSAFGTFIMEDKEISPGYDDKTASFPTEKGGVEALEHAGHGRRGSAALNLVQNPLQVCNCSSLH